MATPAEKEGATFALFDRERDPAETRDVSRAQPEAFRVGRRELELFQDRGDREWSHTRSLLEGQPGERPMSLEACEHLRALGYVSRCP